MRWIPSTASALCVIGLVLAHGPAAAAPTPGQKCAAAKVAAAGKKAAAKLNCNRAFILSGDAVKRTTCLAKAEKTFAAAFTKAEAKAGCVTSGDAAAVEAEVDTCVSEIVTAEPATGTTLPPCTSAGAPCGPGGTCNCEFRCGVPGTPLECHLRVTPGETDCASDADCPATLPICEAALDPANCGHFSFCEKLCP